MRAAKQQSQDLEQAGTFLNSMLASDGSPQKPPQSTKEIQARQANGRAKPPSVNHVTRFADPPAPPPQQPLPEKPDSARSSLINGAPLPQLLKRTDTAKPSAGNSPTSQNSQIMSLVEALSIAKKEIDAQGARVKQLEDMLKEERTAREDAEERARKLEQHASMRPITAVEEAPLIAKDGMEQGSDISDETAQLERNLQQRLDLVVSEMQRMKTDMDKFKERAEMAETDANSARESLAEMIEKIKGGNSKATGSISSNETLQTKRAVKDTDTTDDTTQNAVPKQLPQLANGHARGPSHLPKHVEHAVAAVLQQNNGNGEALAQSAPYVSMLGVVLIGVGIMAYLNSWQKSET